jgi:hypothetical protein
MAEVNALVIMLLCCLTLGLVICDIFKRDNSVNRAYILCILSAILAVLTHFMDPGGYVKYVWLGCSGLWLSMVFLRNMVNRLKGEK